MSAPDQNSDLTTAYMAGFHKRDDEVKKLKKERDKWEKRAGALHETLDDCVNGGVDCKCDFYGGICSCYTGHINKALTRYNQLKGKE